MAQGHVSESAGLTLAAKHQLRVSSSKWRSAATEESARSGSGEGARFASRGSPAVRAGADGDVRTRSIRAPRTSSARKHRRTLATPYTRTNSEELLRVGSVVALGGPCACCSCFGSKQAHSFAHTDWTSQATVLLLFGCGSELPGNHLEWRDLGARRHSRGCNDESTRQSKWGVAGKVWPKIVGDRPTGSNTPVTQTIRLPWLSEKR